MTYNSMRTDEWDRMARMGGTKIVVAKVGVVITVVV